MQARCPRCGYDQDGVVASWRETCPLTGVCSECGLSFRWRDLCNPTYMRTKLFEHAIRHRAHSFMRTLVLIHAPRRFWRHLRMEHWIDASRLVAFVGLSMLALGLLGAALFAAELLAVWIHAGESPADGLEELGWEVDGRDAAAAVVLLVAQFGIMPLSFLLVLESLHRAKVRWMHIVRIWAYSLPLMMWLLTLSLLATYGGVWVYSADIEPFGYSAWRLSEHMFDAAPLLGALLAPAVLLTWWTIGVRRYVRLEHGLLVGLLLTTITVLFVAVGAVLAELSIVRFGI